MSVLGLIVEYNPFHYGHKYHLEKSLKDTNSSYSVAVMSSSFVQRGEPSFIDKWTKAKMAIDNGVDLVIELPSLYSTQSAELFALGAVKILNSLNIVDFLSFGSEEGDIKPLKKISEVLLEEPETFRTNLKKYLSLGKSFPVSRSLALQDYFKNNTSINEINILNILKKSNNILGIEYLKALQNTNSNIKPHTIKRIGADYNDLNTEIRYSSATGIRNTLLNKDIDSCKELLPLESFNLLKEYLLKYGKFNKLENYNNILRYLFLTTDKSLLKNLFDIDEGLENRIVKYIKEDNNIIEAIDKISTKRYPRTRIQRIFIHLLLDLNKHTIENAYNTEIEFIRVLGANKKGLLLLKRIKKESSLNIITKFSDHKHHHNKKIDDFLYFEKKATDIFFLALNLKTPLADMDYYTSPYIK